MAAGTGAPRAIRARLLPTGRWIGNPVVSRAASQAAIRSRPVGVSVPASRARMRRHRWRATAVVSGVGSSAGPDPGSTSASLRHDERARAIGRWGSGASAGRLGGLAPAPAVRQPHRRSGPTLASCRCRRGLPCSSSRPSSPGWCCGWPGTASGRSSSACCSCISSIRPSAGSCDAGCAGASRSSIVYVVGIVLIVEVPRAHADAAGQRDHPVRRRLPQARRELRPAAPATGRVLRQRSRSRAPSASGSTGSSPASARAAAAAGAAPTCRSCCRRHRRREPDRGSLRVLHPAGLGCVHPQGQGDPGRDVRPRAAGHLAVRHVGGHQDGRARLRPVGAWPDHPRLRGRHLHVRRA